MSKLKVSYNSYQERNGSKTNSIVIDGLRLRGDECGQFYSWLREHGMNRRADLVLVALTRAADGKSGAVGGHAAERLTEREFEAAAHRIAERYGEDDIEVL